MSKAGHNGTEEEEGAAVPWLNTAMQYMQEKLSIEALMLQALHQIFNHNFTTNHMFVESCTRCEPTIPV